MIPIVASEWGPTIYKIVASRPGGPMLRSRAAYRELLGDPAPGLHVNDILTFSARFPLPQVTDVRLDGVPARAVVESDGVRRALQAAQAAVQGRGRAFLRPSGTEPVVRVTVEADDQALMQATLERLAEAVRSAAAG